MASAFRIKALAIPPAWTDVWICPWSAWSLTTKSSTALPSGRPADDFERLVLELVSCDDRATLSCLRRWKQNLPRYHHRHRHPDRDSFGGVWCEAVCVIDDDDDELDDLPLFQPSADTGLTPKIVDGMYRYLAGKTK